MQNLTRRDALKVAGGLLVSYLLPAPRQQIDLTAFCDPTGPVLSHDFRRPWELRDWVYATEGHICVRVRPESGDVVTDRRKMPPFGQLKWQHDQLSCWQPLPKLTPQLATDSECPVCRGRGLADGAMVADCTACDGLGHVWPDSLNDDPATPCRPCHGTGTAPPPGARKCRACRGAAYGTYPSVVQLGERYFAADLYEKAQRLGGDFAAGTGHGLKPLAFRFDGGHGLLMPMHSEPTRQRVEMAKRSS